MLVRDPMRTVYQHPALTELFGSVADRAENHALPKCRLDMQIVHVGGDQDDVSADGPRQARIEILSRVLNVRRLLRS